MRSTTGSPSELAQPAEHGTILVIHHAPITYRSPVMQLLDFDDVDRLRDAIEPTATCAPSSAGTCT